MTKTKIIKIVEVFQSLIRKSKFNPDEGSFLGLAGHPIAHLESAMLCLYFVMIIKKIKSQRGLAKYIAELAEG